MVSVTAERSPRAIVVSWVQPNCSDINDDQVNEYMIRYGLHSEMQRTTTPISVTTFTIAGVSLEVFTEYSIEVAAVNSRGVGQYSQPETIVIIDGEYCTLNVKGLYEHCFSLQPLDL